MDDRSVEQKVADFDLADAAVIELADLPDGWVAELSDEEVDDAADQQLFECYGATPEIEEVIRNEEAEAERSYARDDDARLSSIVNVYPNEEYARRSFEPIRDPDFAECYRGVLQAQVGEGVTVEVRVEALTLPALGDEVGGLRFPLVLTGPGGQRDLVVDLVGVRHGRAVTSLAALGPNGPLDPALFDQLLRAAAQRVEEL